MAPKTASPASNSAGPSRQPTTSNPKNKVSAKAPDAKPASPKPKPPASVKDGGAPQFTRKKVEPKSLAEIEAQYPEGSIKSIMVSVLKAQKGHTGLSADGIAAKAKELKLKTFNEEEVAKIKVALSKDPNFCKLQKGIYSLHTFHPKIEIFVRAVVSKKRKADGETKPSTASGTTGGTSTGNARLQASLTITQRKAKEAAAIVTKHRAALKRALSVLEAAKEAAGITTSENKEDRAEVAPAAGTTTTTLAAAAATKESRKERDSVPPQFTPKDLARFELRESEKEYKGDPDDRKAMLEHRQKMQAKQRELDKAKETFIKSQNDTYEKEKNNKRDKLAAVRKAERAVDAAKDTVAAAEKDAEKVGKKLATLVVLFKNSGGKVVDEKQQKQKQPQPSIRAFKPMDDNELDVFLAAQATGAGSSAAAAGTSSQLRPDIFSPAWLDGQDAARLATTVYVSDVFNQFGRYFGLSKPMQFSDFEKALEAASEAVPEERKKKNQKQENDDDGDDTIDGIAQSRTSQFYKGPASPLHDVYYNIMRILIEDMRGKLGTNASVTRRLDLITPGSWPEALRRDVLSSKTSPFVAEYDRPEEHVVDAASALSYDGADGLTADQHLSLLHYLADEVLQTEHLRSILQKREEEAADVKRDVREDLAKERSKLKEITEAEKEVLNNTKKRKRELLGQLHGTKDGEKGGLHPNASARGTKGVDGISGVGGPSRQLSLDTPDLPNDDEEYASDVTEEEEEQPSFELPEELRAFKGNPKNKKAVEEFERKQAAAQKKLEAQRSQYLAEHMHIQREKAEKAIKKLALKKEATEEALAKAQEALEAKMEKLALRRTALGSDRHHRRYWILPKHAVVYVEDEEFGRWGAISTVTQLDELLGSLDKRGLRELALSKALEKKYDSLVLAMRRAEILNATEKKDGKDSIGTNSGKKDEDEKKKKERNVAEPVRQSSRERKQAEFFDPTTGKAIIRTQQQNQSGGSGTSNGDKDGQSVAEYAAQHTKHKALASYFGPSERIAFFEAVEMLLQLYNSAKEFNIGGPSSEGSWKEWLREVHAAAEGRMILSGDRKKKTEAAPNATFLLGLLQGKALELETMIYSAGDNVEASDEEESGGEEDEEEQEGGLRRSGRNRRSDDSEIEDGIADVVAQKEEEGLIDFLPVNFSPVKGGGSKSVTTKLWKSGEWRQRWLLDLRQGSSNARLVYCLGVLKQHSQSLFRFLSGKEEEEDVEEENPMAPAVPAALQKPPLPPGAAKEASRKRRLQEKGGAENRRATRSRA